MGEDALKSLSELVERAVTELVRLRGERDALRREVESLERRLARVELHSGSDESQAELDPARIIGTTIRFPGTDTGDFVSQITGFDAGVFTLADPLPVDEDGNLLVAVDDPYELSVTTTSVTSFDASTGRFELDDRLPAAVSTGQTYTVSVISAGQAAGSSTFVDATRIGEPRECETEGAGTQRARRAVPLRPVSHRRGR